MKRLLYFANQWPVRNSNSKDNLFFSILGSFIERGYSATVVSQSAYVPTDLKDLEEYGVDIHPMHPDQQLKLKVEVSSVELALFDSIQTSNQFSYDIYNKYNKVPQALVLTELQALKQHRKREADTTDDIVKRGVQMWPNQLDCKQFQGVARSDFTIVTPQFLYWNLKDKFPNVISGCEYLPLGQFNDEIELQSFRPARRRKNFYFIGDLKLDYNRDCVKRLLRIWKLISKQLPSQQLHIISSTIPPEFYNQQKELAKQRVVFKSHIDDLDELEKYRMLLAPYRYYCGAPGKIVDSWFYHTPVVTTPYGSESLFLQCPDMTLSKYQGRYLTEKIELNEQETHKQSQIQGYYKGNIIGNDNFDLSFGGLWKNYTDDDFVASVVSLYKDQKLWNKSRQIGEQTIISNHCDSINFKRVIGGVSNAEYLRAISGQSSPKKEAWAKYLDEFSRRRRVNKSK